MKKISKLTALCVGLLTIGIVVCVGFTKADDHKFAIAKNLDIFSSLIKELDMFYVDTLDVNKTMGNGIDAMLYELDPYTVYYPEEDQGELEQMLSNSYGGIGSIVGWNPKTKRSYISEPYEGMPAATSGLKAGDVLLQIDDQDLTGKTNEQVSQLLRGQAGTQLKVKVQRPGVAEPLTFDIVRKKIELPLIPYHTVLDGGIGYINISTFSGKPSKEFKQILLKMKQQGINSLIIDVRDNGGGLIDEAIEIANFFVPRGQTIVTTRGKVEQTRKDYKTMREPIDADIPLAILVSGSTASASEILAGSLQDLDRAVVVGARTYGKGLVQVSRPLPYGGAVKITTSKYYIPSGRCVQAIDYQHRNSDGSVERIPDSLTTVFHTRVGREVRDGGGITPDIVVKKEKLPNLLYYLVSENLIFDYATTYCTKHPQVARSEDFAISDADFNDFKSFVKSKDFKYDQQTEKMLAGLKELAKFEGYWETAQPEFEALEKKLNHDVDRDLEFSKKDIKMMLEVEIQKRYYYQKGGIVAQLKDDKDLDEAVRILKNPAEYRKILQVAPKSERNIKKTKK